MGELNITISDLNACPSCGCNQPLIMQDSKNLKWSIACGKKIQCGTETKKHKELLDASAEWGLKENV
jgi:hypothetical protein